MKSGIIGLTEWLDTAPGAYLLAWERSHFDLAVSDIFGYHALQLGFPELNALQANRMPHKWLALSSLEKRTLTLASSGRPELRTAPEPTCFPRAALYADSSALPFPESSLDLVALPHTLELGSDPHSALREVARVLVPEGRVVISGFNPASLWGLRQQRDHFYQRFGYEGLFLPDAGEYIGYWRLRDWLRLLDFEVESAQFGCYRPALKSQKWLDRFDWMDHAGKRWWPIFGAVYFLVAVKHVRGMRLLEPAWKTRKSPAAAPAVVASKNPADWVKISG
ncbi:class I SAM-dependent methyltransferase [Polaromonas sp. CG_9.11]|uniref:class I SAM-dependent methyltransferase n=1 Tax=Polaromonas sp. CG_9.11 TaxID=2787730 RepID=UPI0018CA2CC5|nr:methyltransferase domain-containing protein [Polaromonas sp. CG_9.11]